MTAEVVDAARPRVGVPHSQRQPPPPRHHRQGPRLSGYLLEQALASASCRWAATWKLCRALRPRRSRTSRPRCAQTRAPSSLHRTTRIRTASVSSGVRLQDADETEGKIEALIAGPIDRSPAATARKSAEPFRLRRRRRPLHRVPQNSVPAGAHGAPEGSTLMRRLRERRRVQGAAGTCSSKLGAKWSSSSASTRRPQHQRQVRSALPGGET